MQYRMGGMQGCHHDGPSGAMERRWANFKCNGAPLKSFKQESSHDEMYSCYMEEGCRSQRKRRENRARGEVGGSRDGERGDLEGARGRRAMRGPAAVLWAVGVEAHRTRNSGVCADMALTPAQH